MVRTLPVIVIIVVLLVAMLILITPVYAEEPIINEGLPLEDNPIEPKVTDTPIVIETPRLEKIVDTQYIPYSKSIITKFLEFVGLKWVETETIAITENTTDVIVDDMLVATIPVDSKFNGMGVHERCLVYQYGTDNWYACEQELL